MADHQPTRCAREAAVGDERDRLAQPRADDRRGHAQQLAHARPTGGALVADDEHVARLDVSGADRVGARLLGVEDQRGAGVCPALRAGELDEASLGREVAAQRVERPAWLERLLKGQDDLAVRRRRVRRRLRERLTGDRGRRAVDVGAPYELADQCGGAADPVEVLGHPATGGRQAREYRCAARDTGEVSERERRARFPCDCEQVQDPVRRATAAGNTRHRVQERAPVEEASRGHPLLDEPDCERPRRRPCVVLGFSLVCRNQAVADAREAETVEGHRHRVGGEVAGARAGAGQACCSSSSRSARGDQPALLRADGLPDVLDRDFAAAPAAGAHRPAVEDDGRLVDACERHQRRRDRLVAADQADEAVEVVRVHHQLDRVGDHLAGDQRGAHPGRRLRLVVRDGDGVEAERDAARGGHALADARRRAHAGPGCTASCPSTSRRRR